MLIKYKNDNIIKFLQGLTRQYNKILLKNLNNYNFRNCNETKDFCKRSKIRGFTKIRDKILQLANKKANIWEGCWSFIDHNNCKINKIKLIDPDIINFIIKNIN